MNTSATQPPELKQYDVAIIGAGLAGSLCAEQLTKAGLSVCVLDKSRGSGGRAGSKRINDTDSCELGTPFILASQASTQKLFEQLNKQNLASPWQQASTKESIAYVGTPKMSSITRHWLHYAHLITNTKVHQLDRINKNGELCWLLRDDKYQSCVLATNLIIATPAHQAAMLLATHADLAVLLLRANQACKGYFSQWAMWLETQASDLKALVEPKKSFIQRMIKDNHKPARNVQDHDRWVIQTSADWTAEHLDQDKEWIAQQICKEFAEHTEQRILKRGEPHRWFFSRYVENRGNKTFAWSPENQVGLAGDWLCQGDAEGALISALTLTDWIIENSKSQNSTL
ncbi:FAD-dependent oxidoreductase [Marinomonas sp. THO17]|uniref:NAD(P)/FAD-dependent oxidoreductase n=1 Tax=Marinomonas sp. THO17 TaxID=3149048 RepID=UPI00336C15BD